MAHDGPRSPEERQDELRRRMHRTERQMRWVVGGVLALAVLLAAAWLLLVRR